MARTAYRYSMGMYALDGSLLVQFPLETDWQPAIESARLEAVRSGRLPLDGLCSPCEIEPIWHPESGEPYLCGFRVCVVGQELEPVTCDFGASYWKPTAKAAASVLCDKGVLQTGDRFLYEVRACRGETDDSDDASRIDAQELPPELKPVQVCLADLIAESVPMGEIADRDMPVFVSREVLRQLLKMKSETEAAEVGSVLVGRLCVDESVPEVFLVVTGQIPARLAESELTRLTFTPDAWSAVQSAMALRQNGEIMCGWFHTHPTKHFSKCPNCGEADDDFAADFFSDEDVMLHRTVFPKAYSVALVLSDRRTTQDTWIDSAAMFGWRRGRISARSFYLLGAVSLPET